MKNSSISSTLLCLRPSEARRGRPREGGSRNSAAAEPETPLQRRLLTAVIPSISTTKTQRKSTMEADGSKPC